MGPTWLPDKCKDLMHLFCLPFWASSKTFWAPHWSRISHLIWCTCIGSNSRPQVGYVGLQVGPREVHGSGAYIFAPHSRFQDDYFWVIWGLHLWMIAEAQQHKWLRESPGKLATHEKNSVRKGFFNVRQTHHAACRELGKFMREANFFHDLPSAAGP